MVATTASVGRATDCTAVSTSAREGSGPVRSQAPTVKGAMGRGLALDFSLCAATLSFFMMSPYGVRCVSMWATALASTAATSLSSEGNQSQGICMRSKRPGVISPISSCWGSSCGPPGSPRRVVMTSTGILKIMLRLVKGLTVLPNPLF